MKESEESHSLIRVCHTSHTCWLSPNWCLTVSGEEGEQQREEAGLWVWRQKAAQLTIRPCSYVSVSIYTYILSQSASFEDWSVLKLFLMTVTYRHPMIISQAQMYAEQPQEACSSKLLSPLVPIEVIPKVLQICGPFQPQSDFRLSVNRKSEKSAGVEEGAEAKTSSAEDVQWEPGVEDDTQPVRPSPPTITADPPANTSSLKQVREPDSAVVSAPPAAADAAVVRVEQNELTTSQDEANRNPEGFCECFMKTFCFSVAEIDWDKIFTVQLLFISHPLIACPSLLLIIKSVCLS